MPSSTGCWGRCDNTAMCLHRPCSVHGLLRASFERRGCATVLTRQLARYPLRLLEPRRPEGYSGALVYVGLVAGGVQAGDCLDMELNLGRGAQALVTTQSATKILTMPTGEAIQR